MKKKTPKIHNCTVNASFYFTDSQINFSEFFTVVSILKDGTMEEKALLVFNMLDTYKDGILTFEEILAILTVKNGNQIDKTDNPCISQLIWPSTPYYNVCHGAYLDYRVSIGCLGRV